MMLNQSRITPILEPNQAGDAVPHMVLNTLPIQVAAAAFWLPMLSSVATGSQQDADTV
jgi:hypothetical protein